MYQEPDTPDRGPLRNVLSRLTMPIDDWAREQNDHRPSYLMVLMSTLLAGLLAACGVALAWASGTFTVIQALVALGAILALAIALLLVIIYQVRQHLLRPLAQLYAWALRMCEGDFDSRIAADQKGHFAKLAFHINRLSEALEGLANEMDDVVSQQTERLRVKNEALEVMFEIAAAINASESLDELFVKCSNTLLMITGASDMVVRLRDDGDLPRVFASHSVRSHGHTQSGTTLAVIPLRYKNRNHGDIRFYGDTEQGVSDTEQHKLLSNVGKHLGMAVAKAWLDEESRKLSLMRERSELARELHDSLAQTITTLRFQVSMLSETLADGTKANARREASSIQRSVEGAHNELRALIANFRAPVEDDRMEDALEALVDRCRMQSEMKILAQCDGPVDMIPAGARVQILRIVGEALSNACKHSGARTARALLRVWPDGAGHLLVEDDGCGIGDRNCEHNPGEQLGLSIMEERARHLGGSLRIDSEAGEGTRVTVVFRASAKSGGSPARAS